MSVNPLGSWQVSIYKQELLETVCTFLPEISNDIVFEWHGFSILQIIN